MITTAEKSEQPVLYLQSLVSQSWPQKHLSDNSCLFTCVVIRMETDPQWSSVSLVFPWRPGKARLWLKTCWDYCGEGSWHADLLHRFRSSVKLSSSCSSPVGLPREERSVQPGQAKGSGCSSATWAKPELKVVLGFTVGLQCPGYPGRYLGFHCFKWEYERKVAVQPVPPKAIRGGVVMCDEYTWWRFPAFVFPKAFRCFWTNDKSCSDICRY